MQPGFGGTGATAAGGIIGVTSKSKDTSLRAFNGRTEYNEWAFVHVQTSQRLGGPGQGGQQGPGGATFERVPNQGPGPGGPQGPSPFGMPPSAFPNQRPDPNQRQGMPMQPPGFGPNRPPVPGGSPFAPSPFGQPVTVPPQQQQRPPVQRPPGQ